MPNEAFAARAHDLVRQMTLSEKVGQLMNAAPAIERLGVPAYNWWNECLHGVGRAGIATVFPQAIGLAAAWSPALLHEVAVVISDEARAKHHEAQRQGDHSIYTGLDFWAPNINIFRDPRWGRGQETYGEDPMLTARLGVAFVRGLQGDDPTYLKVVATPKHFAVHSGPEQGRASFNAQPTERDLWETYLPAFEACVREGQAASIMGAYNRLNGEPCCASPRLLQDILHERWGFDGFVVSDCGAITNIYKFHQVVETAAEAAALAVQAGCDLECGDTYRALEDAVQQGLIDEAVIDQALVRAFTARMRLGMFDPPEQVAYAQIPYHVNDAPEHRALALRAAQEALVLLKNEDGFLPLAKALRRIAVVGPNANDDQVLLGNYNGTPSRSVTPLAGIRAAAGAETQVIYARGCDLARTDPALAAEAVALAQTADVVVFVGGLSQVLEGEEGQQEGVPEDYVTLGDRLRLELPEAQEALLQSLHATGTPIVLVLLNGSAIALNWASAHVPAILEAWYPGEEGGTAIASALFGDYNPGGRLPVTFYRSADDLPPFEDYAMAGRTYRYFGGEPLYPFGFGLSYTQFAYSELALSADHVSDGDTVTLTVDVENTGSRAGDEVAQVYLSAGRSGYPLRQLAAFKRLTLAPRERRTLTFSLSAAQFTRVLDDGSRVLETGRFEVFAGGGQPGFSDGVRGHIEVS
jgi:beta-glucosidase